jgi:cytidine deaminase
VKRKIGTASKTARPRKAPVAEPVKPSSSLLAAAVLAARDARSRAYAPHSGFLVGATVVDDQGQLHVGCNVENASYGLTVCAERNAIAAAVVSGARRITAVAVVTDAEPLASPCGACRQVLAEFAEPGAVVILAAARGSHTVAHTVGSLLPDSFSLE